MQIRGSRHIAAPRPVVWAALNDPATLRAAIPGCTHFTGSPEAGFHATVTQRIGPLRATITGRITLSDVVPLVRYTLIGAETGAATSRAHGIAVVLLTDAGDGTCLDYALTVHVGGRLARLGGRVLDAFAARLAAAFFTRLQAAIAPDAPQQASWPRRAAGRLRRN